jgi:cell division protein FtsQ
MMTMVGCAALVAGGVWWGAQQPLPEFSYLEVSEIQIRGNNHVAAEELLSRLKLRTPVNILQLDMEELVAKIMTHPWIRSASIRRHLPLRLIVTVEERQPIAFLSAGKIYLLSPDAVILEEVQGPPARALPTLRTQWRAKYRVGEHLDEPRILRGLELLEVLRAPPLQQHARVAEVTAEVDGNYIVHLAGEGAILRISAAESLPQFSRLDVALRRRGQRLESFAYVDLRFPGRVILNPSEKGG